MLRWYRDATERGQMEGRFTEKSDGTSRWRYCADGNDPPGVRVQTS